MKVNIITPEKTLYKGKAKSIYVPGINGEFQMLNHHAAIVSVLKEGKVKIEEPEMDNLAPTFTQGEKGLYEVVINGGVIEMNNDIVTILAE